MQSTVHLLATAPNRAGLAPAGIDPLGAWLSLGLCVLAVAMGLALRRRLPPGVAMGLLIAGLSGLMLLTYLTSTMGPADAGPQNVTTRPTASATQPVSDHPPLGKAEGEPGVHDPLEFGIVMVGIAAFWLLIAVWTRPAVSVTRAGAAVHETPAGPAEARRDLGRRELGSHAAIVCGLLALAAVISPAGSGATVAGGLLLVLALVGLLAAGLQVWPGTLLGRFAGAALAGVLIWVVVPKGRVVGVQSPMGWLQLLVGGLALALAVAAIMLDWRRRSLIWRMRPEQLTEPPPPRRILHALAVVCAGVVGLSALVLPDRFATPFGMAFAAVATLTVAHRWRVTWFGVAGLALAEVSVITAALAWLPHSPATPLLGWLAAGAYLLWLARLWEQQLNRGEAWTTAGRLIPAAWRLGCIAAGGSFAVAAAWVMRGGTAGPVMSGAACAAGLALLALLVRQSTARPTRATAGEHAVAALLACLTALATMAPLYAAAVACGWPGSVPVWIALATVLLA
ncbi:MAG: hypothetical protein AB1716_15295, partial [Planctomycetota bacterium]